MFALTAGVVLGIAAMQQDAAPRLPYVEYDCSYECHEVKDWAPDSGIPLYSTWRSTRHKLGSLPAHEAVHTLACANITIVPGRAEALRDDTELGVRKGERYATFMEIGEGNVSVWVNGRMREASSGLHRCGERQNADEMFCQVSAGKKDVWLKVRRKNGRVYWVRGTDFFEKSKACIGG